MSTYHDGQSDEGRGGEGGLLEAVVRDNVMYDLGSPAGLHLVQVRRVWGASYRVNVFVGDDASAKIAHSYFLTEDGDGKILTSDPALARLY